MGIITLGRQAYRMWRRRRKLLLAAAAGSAGAVALYRMRAAGHGRRYHRPAERLPSAGVTVWRFDNDCLRLPAGNRLRIETGAPAVIHWSADKWQTVRDVSTLYSGSGTHRAELDTSRLAPDATVIFTFFWSGAKRWEGEDFLVHVTPAA